MSEKRITYKNLGEIFVIEIEAENIEVGTIENYLPPFNKYVIIKNIYKYPDRVKEYAESCQYTNAERVVYAAPVLRSFAPISNALGNTVIPALNESFKRKIIDNRYVYRATQFSYHDPQSIKYHQHQEPHADGMNTLPLLPTFPHMNSFDEYMAGQPHASTGKSDSIAGVIFLDETFGTEISINKKNMSYYRSKTSGTWGLPLPIMFNDSYYPEGTDSHYEHIITLGGEYNSAVFYYGAVAHRPYYPGASDEDLKRGRLTHNIWFDDVTGTDENED